MKLIFNKNKILLNNIELVLKWDDFRKKTVNTAHPVHISMVFKLQVLYTQSTKQRKKVTTHAIYTMIA
jgi:hypothetical protein